MATTNEGFLWDFYFRDAAAQPGPWSPHSRRF